MTCRAKKSALYPFARTFFPVITLLSVHGQRASSADHRDYLTTDDTGVMPKNQQGFEDRVGSRLLQRMQLSEVLLTSINGYGATHQGDALAWCSVSVVDVTGDSIPPISFSVMANNTPICYTFPEDALFQAVGQLSITWTCNCSTSDSKACRSALRAWETVFEVVGGGSSVGGGDANFSTMHRVQFQTALANPSCANGICTYQLNGTVLPQAGSLQTGWVCSQDVMTTCSELEYDDSNPLMRMMPFYYPRRQGASLQSQIARLPNSEMDCCLGCIQRGNTECKSWEWNGESSACWHRFDQEVVPASKPQAEGVLAQSKPQAEGVLAPMMQAGRVECHVSMASTTSEGITATASFDSPGCVSTFKQSHLNKTAEMDMLYWWCTCHDNATCHDFLETATLSISSETADFVLAFEPQQCSASSCAHAMQMNSSSQAVVQSMDLCVDGPAFGEVQTACEAKITPDAATRQDASSRYFVTTTSDMLDTSCFVITSPMLKENAELEVACHCRGSAESCPGRMMSSYVTGAGFTWSIADQAPDGCSLKGCNLIRTVPAGTANITMCLAAANTSPTPPGDNGPESQASGSPAVGIILGFLAALLLVPAATVVVLRSARRRTRGSQNDARSTFAQDMFRPSPQLSNARLLRSDTVVSDAYSFTTELGKSMVFAGSRYEWEGTYSHGAHSYILYGRDLMKKNTLVVAKLYLRPSDFDSDQQLLFTAWDQDPFLGLDVYPPKGQRLPCVVMPRGTSNFRTMLDQHASKRSGDESLVLLLRVLKTLEPLLSFHYVHGHLCPENITYFEGTERWNPYSPGTWMCRGASYLPSDHYLLSSHVIRYAAPEMVLAAVKGKALTVQPSIDLWSVGVIAWEVLVGAPLFGDDISNHEVSLMMIGAQPFPWEKDETLWTAIENLQVCQVVQQLLQREPWNRGKLQTVISMIQDVCKTLNSSARGVPFIPPPPEPTQSPPVLSTVNSFSSALDHFRTLSRQNSNQVLHLQSLRSFTPSPSQSDVSTSSPVLLCALSYGEVVEHSTRGSGALSQGALQSRRSLTGEDYINGVCNVSPAPSGPAASFLHDHSTDDNTAVLLKAGATYIIRMEVRFGSSQPSKLPISSVEELVVRLNDGTLADSQQLRTTTMQSSDYFWQGFAIWDTSIHGLVHGALTSAQTGTRQAAMNIDILFNVQGNPGLQAKATVALTALFMAEVDTSQVDMMPCASNQSMASHDTQLPEWFLGPGVITMWEWIAPDDILADSPQRRSEELFIV